MAHAGMCPRAMWGCSLTRLLFLWLALILATSPGPAAASSSMEKERPPKSQVRRQNTVNIGTKDAGLSTEKIVSPTRPLVRRQSTVEVDAKDGGLSTEDGASPARPMVRWQDGAILTKQDQGRRGSRGSRKPAGRAFKPTLSRVPEEKNNAGAQPSRGSGRMPSGRNIAPGPKLEAEEQPSRGNERRPLSRKTGMRAKRVYEWKRFLLNDACKNMIKWIKCHRKFTVLEYEHKDNDVHVKKVEFAKQNGCGVFTATVYTASNSGRLTSDKDYVYELTAFSKRSSNEVTVGIVGKKSGKPVECQMIYQVK